jgi:hypothetical protein
MSIADHFDHTPDAGFVRNYDSGSARRQFNVSLMLVAVIAVAALALGFLVRFDQSVGDRAAVSPVMPSYVGSLSR